MATRLTRLRHGSSGGAIALVLVCLLGGCGGPAEASPRSDGAPDFAPPSPVGSLTPGMAATVSVLRSALAPQGLRLEQTGRAFRPSESESLAVAPRAVLQVDVGDPRGGWVVVYEFSDPATAATAGQEFARYLASGFGQTNYPLDARFGLSQLAGTLVFTWWSPERAADRAKAGEAFEVLSGVGQPIAIVR